MNNYGDQQIFSSYLKIRSYFLHDDEDATTERVRETLVKHGVDVRRYERTGSLTLLDFTKKLN